jgi:AcrR family transcriptional regulator
MNRRWEKSALAPRKTAVQTRATRTVEAIVEAAARILETAGLDGYSTNVVAGRAGVSIGSLYQYFPNKDAITLALIERESSARVKEVQDAEAIEDWRKALERMVGAAVRHQLRRPALARLLDLEEARLPTGDIAAPGVGAIFSAVRAVLARAPIDRFETIDTMAADIIGLTRGIADMAGSVGELNAGNLERRIGRAIFGYLLASPKTP